MSGDFDFERFSAGLREEFTTVLGSAKTSSDFAAIMRQTYARVEDELARGLDPEEAKHIACGAGCGVCCVVNVAVLFPEAVAIAHHVNTALADAAQGEQVKKIEDLYKKVLWLDDGERLSLHRPCAFLDSHNSCGIYPLRPLLCRSITSIDANTCRQALAASDDEEAPLVLMNLFQKKLFESAYSALGEALKERGLDGGGAKLTVAVRNLLARPQLLEDYLAGGAVPKG